MKTKVVIFFVLMLGLASPVKSVIPLPATAAIVGTQQASSGHPSKNKTITSDSLKIDSANKAHSGRSEKFWPEAYSEKNPNAIWLKVATLMMVGLLLITTVWLGKRVINEISPKK